MSGTGQRTRAPLPSAVFEQGQGGKPAEGQPRLVCLLSTSAVPAVFLCYYCTREIQQKLIKQRVGARVHFRKPARARAGQALTTAGNGRSAECCFTFVSPLACPQEYVQ